MERTEELAQQQKQISEEMLEELNTAYDEFCLDCYQKRKRQQGREDMDMVLGIFVGLTLLKCTIKLASSTFRKED